MKNYANYYSFVLFALILFSSQQVNVMRKMLQKYLKTFFFLTNDETTSKKRQRSNL